MGAFLLLPAHVGEDGTPAKRARGPVIPLAARAPQRTRRGRPRKFGRPSRAVTLTLPEDVIARLSEVNRDLSRAVVQMLEEAGPIAPRSAADLEMFGDSAVIVVPHSPAITALTDAELVPLTDGRALLAFDDTITVPQFELQVRDALANPSLERDERAVFEAIAEILRSARRDKGIRLKERSIVVLQLSRRAIERRLARAEPRVTPAS